MDLGDALLAETRRFGALFDGADGDTPVPTCPGWTLRQLFRHVGRGHRWSAQIIAERRLAPLDPRDVADGAPPPDPDGAQRWLVDGAQAVLDAVATVGADTPVWAFPHARPAEWWIRRRLHEATVHDADAALALGRPVDLSAPIAADGVDEWLLVVAALRTREAPLDPGTSLHLHAGEGGEWLVRAADGGVAVSREHAKATVAVRGGATDLLLGLTRRIPADDARLDVVGDAAVWRRWLDRTPF